MFNVTLPPIDLQRQGAVALPSLRAHLPECFEDERHNQSDLVSIRAVSSPHSSDLLLPPIELRRTGSCTLREVFPELFQRTAHLKFRTEHTSGASTPPSPPVPLDNYHQRKHVVLLPLNEQRISCRTVSRRDDGLAGFMQHDDTRGYPAANPPTPPATAASLLSIATHSGSLHPILDVSSDSDSSLDISPELLGAAKILYTMRCGPSKTVNYYESDADEDEEPIEECPKNLKRLRTGGVKTRCTVKLSSAFEETSDDIETEREESSGMVQGRRDEQASEVFYSSQQTKRLRLDVSQTSESQPATGTYIRLPPLASVAVAVEQGINDENASSVVSKKNANVKAFADSTKWNSLVFTPIHKEDLKQNHTKELPFADDIVSDANSSEAR